MIVLGVIILWCVYWSVAHSKRWQVLAIGGWLVCLFWNTQATLYVSLLVGGTYYLRTKLQIILIVLVGQLLLWKGFHHDVPLGLSYLTFFLIHYAIDFRRLKIPEHNGFMLVARSFFVPLFSAGPIERFSHFVQNQSHRPIWIDGVWRLSLGCVQKWIVSEGLLELYHQGWDGESLASQGMQVDAFNLWCILSGMFAQLYFDFAGYSNIAIGAGALFGFKIADNFRSPLLALNPADFWKRWHISLSQWCQEYIYLPVLGYTRNPYLAIFGTFLVMGAWHALSLQWIFWGVYHAFGLVVHLRWRRWSRGGIIVHTKLWKCTSWVLLMGFLALSGVFTQLHGIEEIALSFKLILHAFGMA